MNLKFFSLLGSGLCASLSYGSGVFADTYTADKTFTDALTLTSTGVAFDGTNYYSSSAGTWAGDPLAQYDESGNLLETFPANLSFRSVFSKGDSLYARQFSLPTIYRMDVPGVFSDAVTLTGGFLNWNASVVTDVGGVGFVSCADGKLSRWDDSGASLGVVNLSGYSSSGYPSNRGIVVVGNTYVTYDQGVITGWDASGNQVGTATLVGANPDFYGSYSFSYASDGRIWIVDGAGLTWRGFKIDAVPEPSGLAVLGLGLLAVARRRSKNSQ